MLKGKFAVLLLCSLMLANLPVRAQQTAAQMPAAARPAAAQNAGDVVERIKDEGINRSEVMEIMSYLTDVVGPCLTNSPQMKRANEWTRDKMASWGLANARLEPWGEFGRGWSLKRFSAEVTSPQSFPLIAYPKAWSPGTQGPVTAEVVHVDAKTEADLEKYRGQLGGKIVLTSQPRELKAHFEPQGTRLSEKELLELANAPDPASRPARPSYQFTPERIQQLLFDLKKSNFLQNEGALLLVDPGRGDGGTIFVQSASVPAPVPDNIDPNNPNSLTGLYRRGTPAYSKVAPKITPQIMLAAEHYNRIVRMLRAGEKVQMTVNLDVEFHEEDLKGYNTVAEIPGTDLKDEVVMLGGHMDSWHGGTGATDNGAGVAVAMEAARIIQKLGLRPRRTIRVALWSGEEQGLLGSRGYVREHFGEMQGQGNSAQLVRKPNYDKLSVYFNLDNGTGKIRGVYLQGNSAAWPIFRQWLAPFAQMGANTLTLSNTGGTDHLAFDAVGLPGFQFIQDEVEYETRTHHSNMDTFDRIQADDMKQAATIMAAFVYQAAMMDQKFPRKPAPATR